MILGNKLKEGRMVILLNAGCNFGRGARSRRLVFGVSVRFARVEIPFNEAKDRHKLRLLIELEAIVYIPVHFK